MFYLKVIFVFSITGIMIFGFLTWWMINSPGKFEMDCNSAVMCKVLDTRTGIVSQIPPGILGKKVQGEESDYRWLPNFRMILGGAKFHWTGYPVRRQ